LENQGTNEARSAPQAFSSIGRQETGCQLPSPISGGEAMPKLEGEALAGKMREIKSREQKKAG